MPSQHRFAKSMAKGVCKTFAIDGQSVIIEKIIGDELAQRRGMEAVFWQNGKPLQICSILEQPFEGEQPAGSQTPRMHQADIKVAKGEFPQRRLRICNLANTPAPTRQTLGSVRKNLRAFPEIIKNLPHMLQP